MFFLYCCIFNGAIFDVLDANDPTEPPPVPVLVLVVPAESVLVGKEVRRSVRLKRKGLAGSDSGAGSNHETLLSGTCPLLTKFSFTRLSPNKVLDLFRSYRIILGENEAQRDIILKSLQNGSREIFYKLSVTNNRENY
jgi:hypothetical protein